MECTNILPEKESMQDKTCKAIILNLTGKLHYDCQMFPIITYATMLQHLMENSKY